jgi:hypothetical protein
MTMLEPVDWNQPREAQPRCPKGWKWSKKEMLCSNPNCKYHGFAAEKPKGSRFVLWLMLAMFLLPGFIYAILHAGQVYCCPKCRSVVNLA